MGKSRAARKATIKKAKAKIVELTKQGVKINPEKASVFTNIEMEKHRKSLFAGFQVSKLNGAFDNSVVKRNKGPKVT